MNSSLSLIAATRPVVSLVIIALYMAQAGDVTPRMALFAVSAAFFATSSAVVVGWIPSTPRWRMAVVWAEIVLATVLNWVAATAMPGGPMPALYIPILMTIGLDFDRRSWAPTMGVLVLAAAGANFFGDLRAAAVSPLTPSQPVWLMQAVLYGSLLLFAGSVGILVRDLREERLRSETLLHEVEAARATAERAHRQLMDSVAGLQQMAVLEERQRLAREIHDSVAHSLTALVVQLQAGNRLLARATAGGPPAAATGVGESAAAFLRSEAVAREALQETRRAVRALHPAGLDQDSELAALQRLARDFALATGIDVAVTGGAGLERVPADPQRLEHLYRIFQEALTNAQRHGQAEQVKASLTFAAAEASAGSLRLTIWNDGRPPRDLTPGVGLRSMADRVRALGGTLRLEPGAAGLTVSVSIPVAAMEGQS